MTQLMLENHLIEMVSNQSLWQPSIVLDMAGYGIMYYDLTGNNLQLKL